MNKTTLMISCSALMAACTSSPPSVAPAVASTEEPACVQRVAATGSNLVQKQGCIPSSDADRTQAQKDAQAMRDQQARSSPTARPSFGKGGGGG